MLTLNPPPGLYTTDQTITVTPAPGYTFISSSDGTDPMVVKTIASTNKLGSEMPYIQSIDNGRGRMIFDGAFGKYYNSLYSTSLSSPGNRLLTNALNYIAKDGGKRVLAICDRHDKYLQYHIKNTVEDAGFGLVFTTIPQLSGYSVTIKDPNDYGGVAVNPTYAELSAYDAIFFMSATEGILANEKLTTSGAQALAQAHKAGIGIYICTDHQGWCDSANILLSAITSARFEGIYDFSPGTTVAYNKALHGESPLFFGMAGSDLFYASASDSNVVQIVQTPQATPATIGITSGYTTLKFAVIDPDGQVGFEQYGYNIGQPPIIELLDEQGASIETWPETLLRQRRINFKYLPGTFGNASGFVKVGDTVVGEFTNQVAGPLNVTWINTAYTLSAQGNEVTMPTVENQPIAIELYEPIVYQYTWDFNRKIFVATPSVNGAAFIHALNSAEFSSEALSAAQPLAKAKALLHNPGVEPAVGPAKSIQNVYKALTGASD